MSKNKIIIGIFSFLLLASLVFYIKTRKNIACETAPIGEEQLIRILADVHEGETIINTVTDYTRRDSVAQSAYSKILKINKVTMAALDTSLAIYFKTPEQAQALYEKVQNRISMDAAAAK